MTNTFENWDDDNLNIKTNLLRGIYGNGFEQPSPIQKQAIIPMIQGKDLIAQAQSGTGKTGAFTIGMLQYIDESIQETQAIILSPTRELASQTNHVINTLGKMMHIKTSLTTGTISVNDNIKEIEQKPHIIVGCPGRLNDMLRRHKVNINKLKLIILDEADEMLSVGFKDQVYQIFQYLPETITVSLFSATLPKELEELTNKFMRDPIKILVKNEMLTLEGISQYYIALDTDNDKFNTIKDLFGWISSSQAIIYCNSLKRVSDLYSAMIKDEFPVCCIHSGMDKEQRNETYNDFKNGKHRVCISSNVTARGIDIQQVSTVINFDIPKCAHTYLHRIGRSGRWGRKGVAINFVTKYDIHIMRGIEQLYETEIKELTQDVVV
jgi:translation initiation factor 4A